MNGQRELDVVILGATGFTGRLACEHLARRLGDSKARVGIAGRSRDKLEDLKRRLVAIDERAARIEIVEANVDDRASLDAMAERARVVLTFVGPYIKWGEPVVAACVDRGASCLDITGEPAYVARILERYDERAREKGVRVVSCCGFDSEPADLGVLFTVRELQKRGAPMDDVHVESYFRFSSRPSGGTWASALDIMSNPETHGAPRRITSAPPAIDGRRVRFGHARIGWDRDLRAWIAPMPVIDPAIVVRSAKLIPDYGHSFEYAQHIAVRGVPVVFGVGLGMRAIGAAARVGPVREALEKILPAGAGPSAERRAKSWFRARFVGRAGDRTLVTEVRGADPGYDEASKMAVESALCLAEDGDRLPNRTGVLTPAAAMGEPLIDRLRAHGISFEVVREA